MWDWFERLLPRFGGELSFLFNSCFLTPAAIFALGDLMCSTLFQLAFGRYGLKLSSRALFVKPVGGE